MSNRIRKSVVLIFAIMLCNDVLVHASVVGSSESRHMLADGKVWECVETSLVDESMTFKSVYTVSGDTIIGNVTCKKCYLCSERLRQNTPQFCCGLKEEGSRVYAVSEGGQVLLCDFSMQAGECVTVSEGGVDYAIEVTAIDYVDGGSNMLKRQTVAVRMLSTDEMVTVSWIEGVGPSRSPLTTPGSLFQVSSYDEEVTRCLENGTPVYTGNARDENSNGMMLVEGRVWNMEESYYRCPPEYIGDVMAVYSQKSVYGIHISGDTIVDGVAYKTLVKDVDYVERTLAYTVPADAPGIEQYQRWEGGTEPCTELLREEDGKVFMRYKNYAQETLLFDFTLEAGDAFMMAYQVEDVDTICTTGGLYMRRLRLNYDVWVEGIGGPDGPVRNNSFQVNGDPTISLLSVYDGDNCIFSASDFSAPAYHGTINNMSFPQASPQSVTTPFFDLQGRRLSGLPTLSGLYIKDGRKVVVR